MAQIFNIYYVHGMGSSKESKKFKLLQSKYEDIECLDWKIGDNLKDFVNESVIKIKNKAISNNNTNIIISSAVGSNLAMQISFFLEKKGIGVCMIMINPLFKESQFLDIDDIPEDVLKYIIDIRKISDSLIFIGENDTVIDHNKITKRIIRDNSFVEVLENSHKLEDLEDCFEEIDLFIVSRHFSE